MKSPTVSKFESNGRSFYKIVRANEKHFTNPKQSCLECNATLSGIAERHENALDSPHKTMLAFRPHRTLSPA